MLLFKLLFLVSLIKLSISAKILALAPFPVYSHQIVFRPLWRELSLRGHQVTLLTTDPINDPSLINLTEIDSHFAYDILKKHETNEFAANSKNHLLSIDTLLTALREIFYTQLGSKEVQELIHNRNIHFDLVITEVNAIAMIPFGWRFNCPWIGIASMDALDYLHEICGNAVNAALYPNYNVPAKDPENLSFYERFILVFLKLFGYYYKYSLAPKEYAVYKKHFGNDLPSLDDLRNNISMLFINTNDIFYNKRSLNRNTVTFGDGIHIQPPKPLPEDLKKYLDEATEGVIYFSLGTNIKYHTMKEELRTYIEAFRDLPYKILWKIDAENIENLPKNIKTLKWVPQQDLLRHPNIKAFIMQAGLQSLQEALINQVPVITIPIFGDQLYNSAKVVKNGYGIRLDRDKVTKETLKEAVLEIMNNPKYRDNAKKLSEILQDEPMTGLEKLVWWTEYVIRHKGAAHLRSHVNDVPFYKAHLLDVYAFVFIVIFIIFYILIKLVRLVLSLLQFITRKSKEKIS